MRKSLMICVTILCIVFLLSCSKEFDNVLDPTIGTKPSAVLNLIDVFDHEIILGDSTVNLVPQNMQIEFGVSNDKDTDVMLRLDIEDVPGDSIFASYYFSVEEDSLITRLDFSTELLNNDQELNFLLYAEDSFDHSDSLKYIANIDKIFPVIDENSILVLREPIDTLEIIFSEPILMCDIFYSDSLQIDEEFEINATTLTFTLDLNELGMTDYGYKDFLFNYRDIAGNWVINDTVSILYAPEFSMVTLNPANNSNFNINNSPDNIIVEFSGDVSNIVSLTANSEDISSVASINQTDPTKVTINYNFPANHEGPIDFEGEFTDIFSSQVCNTTWSYFYDGILPEIEEYLPSTIEVPDAEIVINFSESIESCAVMYDGQQFEGTINDSSYTFSCGFTDGDFGEKTLSVDYSDSAGNLIENDQIIIEYNQLEFTVSISPPDQTTVTDLLLLVNMEFTVELSDVLELTSTVNSVTNPIDNAIISEDLLNVSFEYDFEEIQGEHLFHGLFKDKYDTELNVTWSYFWDDITEMTALPISGSLVLVDSLECTLNFTELITECGITMTSPNYEILYNNQTLNSDNLTLELFFDTPNETYIYTINVEDEFGFENLFNLQYIHQASE